MGYEIGHDQRLALLDGQAVQLGDVATHGVRAITGNTVHLVLSRETVNALEERGAYHSIDTTRCDQRCHRSGCGHTRWDDVTRCHAYGSFSPVGAGQAEALRNYVHVDFGHQVERMTPLDDEALAGLLCWHCVELVEAMANDPRCEHGLAHCWDCTARRCAEEAERLDAAAGQVTEAMGGHAPRGFRIGDLDDQVDLTAIAAAVTAYTAGGGEARRLAAEVGMPASTLQALCARA
jgi:hypothetical protein